MQEERTYTFDELDKSTQEHVLNTWRENDCSPWSDDWQASLKAFEAVAPVKVNDWSVGYPRTYVDFDMETRGYWGSRKGESEDWADEMTGVRLWKYLRRTFARLLRKDCPLTGYCGDDSLLKPIRDAIASHPATLARTTLRDVMKDCLDSWASDFEDDIDHWHSEECIREEIEANEYRFDEDGRLA